MAELTWQPGAAEDVDGIARRVAQHSEHYAKLQAARIFSAAEVLKRYPLVGHFVPEMKSARLREIHAGEYRVIYHITGDQVNVLAVAHMKRDLSRSVIRRRTKDL